MSQHNLINKEITLEVCPQLKQLRLDRQLSLEEVQAAVRISGKLLKRIEDGKCLTFSHFLRLLDFYGKKMRITLEDK